MDLPWQHFHFHSYFYFAFLSYPLSLIPYPLDTRRLDLWFSDDAMDMDMDEDEDTYTFTELASVDSSH